ncbi:hypothetical protein A3Q56_02392 [Intoshia linei]|uniref:Uncharacterized protein n=1 Tax=Intoshia linei TaxID=1819745 RepID=A0A177B8H0_9BILA|nr:hypothetical protein A3Q56_02392 [Intoshia linei]
MNSNSSNIESKKRKCMYEYNCLNAKKITNENEFMDPLEETKLYMTKFRKWNITRRCEVLHNILGELNQFEIKFIMKAIKPNFQRDFIKQLPVNVAIQIIQRIPSKYMV